MNNPYPKQPSGSYRSILAVALQQAGEENLSRAFNSGALRLAIVDTITGAVETHQGITKRCIEVLEPLRGNETADYYHWGLKNRQFVVASSKGAFVYDPDDNAAKEYVLKKLNEQPGEVSYFG
jgi:hypothetical protein